MIYKKITVNQAAIELELDELVSILPDWRRRYALSYRRPIDQYLCAKSYLLLSGILSENFDIHGMPEFSYNSFGKPFLKAYPDIHFNISHCAGSSAGNDGSHFSGSSNNNSSLSAGSSAGSSSVPSSAAILCAVADEPVGVDIENVQFDDELARAVLSDAEYRDVLASADPGIRFTEYWTMKESRLKLEGTGLTDDIKTSLNQDDDISYRLFRDEKHGLVSCLALHLPKQ